MRERPILFSPWSVQRILANGKFQTRRVISPQPPHDDNWNPKRHSEFPELWLGYSSYGLMRNDVGPDSERCEWRCPHGATGDVLWVKEPFSLSKAQDGRTPAEAWEHVKETKQGLTVLYRAGGWKSVAPFERQEPIYPDNEPMPEWAGRRRHGMFMPRWASRITLEITDIRVERVQEISEDDAEAEGAEACETGLECSGCPWIGFEDSPGVERTEDEDWEFICPECKEVCAHHPINEQFRFGYRHVWDEINGKTHPWSSNPWCWCISFRRLEMQ